MKRKLIIFIPVIAILVICGSILIAKQINVNAESLEYSNVFFTKSYYDKQDDGWIYFFKIYLNADNDKNRYSFGGYNMKYEKLEGYSAYMIDKKTGEILDEIDPGYVSLSNSHKYGEDLKKINNFFNEKQFNDKITINDLGELKINNIDKNYLLSIFNKAILSNEEEVNGEYSKAPVFGLKTKDSTDNSLQGKWLITYLLKNGNLYDVNIEFVDKEGNYLFKENNNKSINKLDDQTIKIKNEIILNQKFDIAKENNTFSESINSDLLSLLTDLQNELDSYKDK